MKRPTRPALIGIGCALIGAAFVYSVVAWVHGLLIDVSNWDLLGYETGRPDVENGWPNAWLIVGIALWLAAALQLIPTRVVSPPPAAQLPPPPVLFPASPASQSSPPRASRPTSISELPDSPPVRPESPAPPPPD